jgi:FdhD protein
MVMVDSMLPAPTAHCTIGIHRLTRAGVETTRDAVAVEAPLEIRVEGRPVAVAMRTPGHDRELAAGFLLSEGVIAAPGDVFEISTCPSRQPGADGAGASTVDVLMARPEAVDFDRLTRHVFTASSCGLCGKAVVDEVLRQHPSLAPDSPHDIRVPADVIFGMPAALREAQATFAATGGLHASALFDLDGRLLSLHEDVGRHNALDKLLGECWLGGRWPLDRHVLMLSGRISFELVQKALVARLPVVVAISAPSSLAVATAEAAGITLCGFLRDERMNVYTHAERIVPARRNGAVNRS